MNLKNILQQNKISVAVQIALTVLGTYGLCHLLDWLGVDKSAYTVLVLFFFGAVWFLLNWAKSDLAELGDAKSRRRRIGFAFIVSFLFSLSMFMGFQLQVNGMTECGFAGKGMLALRSLCLSVAVFPLANAFFRGAEKIKSTEQNMAKKWRPAAIFGICAAIIFVCLIPVWMAFYPIIMSYDFHRQINEAYNGFAYFYPYQPIAHTWVIWVFLQLGESIGSLEAGFGYMALSQIFLYALVMGYACSVLYRISGKKWVVVLSAVFFAIFPFNTVLVVCTTKDVLFTILFVLFVMLLLEHALFTKEESTDKGKILCRKNIIDVLLVLEGCLMMQFRNNALYAVAVFMVLYCVLVPRKEKLRTLILCILLIAGGKFTGVVIKEAIGTQINNAKIEMFSVPIQQFARVGYYHGDNLDIETAEELNKYVPRERWENYYSPLADSVKVFANEASFVEYGEFASFWVRMALRFPNEFIDAFLELTRGYWFLDDTSWAENLGWGVESRMGAIFAYNSSEIAATGESILNESKFPWLEQKLLEITSGNAFYDWPIVSIIFRSAFYPWAMFLITMVYLYKKQKRQMQLSLLLWLYFATMLLGPVVQLRYMFPLMVLVPVLGAMLFMKEEERNV